MFDEKTGVAGHIASPQSMPAPTAAGRPAAETTETEARILTGQYGDLPAAALVAVMLREVFRRRIALVSSFGTESAVLLDLVARVDPATPVLFLDTGRLFAETLRYRDTLQTRLGLTDIRILRPNARSLDAEDRDGALWRTDPDRCCHLRKVAPLTVGLAGFDAWITGRKCFHGGDRERLSTITTGAGGKTKINPLANWTPMDIATYFKSRHLPLHEMAADGYRSIGCIPCTDRAGAGEGPRAGRWRHTGKTECGIHGRLFLTG